MVTQNSTPSGQVRSTTTPTGEESVTPVSGPSGLGELSALALTESYRKLEVIQRAQVGSLMGADRNKEPQEKTPKRQSPALAAQPKKFALEMWVEIKTSTGVYTTPDEDSYSVDFAIDTINRAYPRCTGMYLGETGHMLAFYGKKTNPRAGLLHSQAVTASKAIMNIPTWMGYFARWRVQCISISKASEILAGCKRLEKENLRRARWELQNQFSTMWLDSTLSAAARPFQPKAAPLPSQEEDEPWAYSIHYGLARSSPTPGLSVGSPVRRTSLSHHQSSDDDGISTDTSVSDKPPTPTGGMGAEGVKVARVVVTPMELTPPEVGVTRRMDFLARSKYPNLGARRVILMMWPMPLGSGPTVSPIIVIIMRVLI